ncbi:hypothetical protein AB0M20_37530, partial [Actinoplanes sp. NPDC051633]|uniref:hypothetical protein n=1 Tax=Actinoplanes sp. NPDC051633 TaxID=3155670 RepID=UPI003429361C
QGGPPYRGPHPTQPYPQPGYPIVPPPKSRAVPITLLSVAVVLVLCVGGSVAAVLIARNTANSIGSSGIGETAYPTQTPTRTPTGTPPSKITVVEPATLGGRALSSDTEFDKMTDELESTLEDIPKATDTVGAVYGTAAKRNVVVAAAVAVPLAAPAVVFPADLTITNRTTVSPGPLGGTAKCGKARAEVDMVLCGWADKGSAGWFIWFYTSLSEAKREFITLRGQVEKSS